MPTTATDDTASAKPERLEARVSRELKSLVQRAADIEGRSLTDFVVSALQESARETIRRHEVLTLTMRDSARFVEALLKPRGPNAALRKAARRHQEMTSG